MITLVTGRMGSGKTLYLVQMVYEALRKGVVPFSNIHIEDAEHFDLQSVIDSDYAPCDYRAHMVAFDCGETLWASPKEPTDTGPLRDWLKKHYGGPGPLDFFMTTQFPAYIPLEWYEIFDQRVDTTFNAAEHTLHLTTNRTIKNVDSLFGLYNTTALPWRT